MSRGGADVRAVIESARASGGLTAGGPAHSRAHFRAHFRVSFFRRTSPWLQLGENAAEVAQRIHVHPQTVRYRTRQIHELFGDQLRDPERRFELQLALRIRTLSTGRPAD